jgi:hypothetical protein
LKPERVRRQLSLAGRQKPGFQWRPLNSWGSRDPLQAGFSDPCSLFSIPGSVLPVLFPAAFREIPAKPGVTGDFSSEIRSGHIDAGRGRRYSQAQIPDLVAYTNPRFHGTAQSFRTVMCPVLRPALWPPYSPLPAHQTLVPSAQPRSRSACRRPVSTRAFPPVAQHPNGGSRKT